MTELRVLKQRYLTYLETQWGGSAKMVENYDRYLERFISFAKVTRPSDITQERVAAFRLHLVKQAGASVGGSVTPMKQTTQNYYLTAIRMFLNYLQDEGFETISSQQIKLAKISNRSVEMISSTELDRLRAVPDRKSIEGKRDRAIIELLCSTGIRISELCKLSTKDINVTRNEFTVSSAQGKKRTVFLGAAASKAMDRYLQARQDSDPALFLRYGRKFNDGGDLGIHPRAVQRMIKLHAASAGITRKVTPQILRHTFADELLKNGADIRSVQTLLGHATIHATRIYI